MTDKELLYIKTIAEEHNITKAAEKLHVAQPSLTQCIKRIEKSLDCPLFYRKKTGLVLTDGGKLYYETACRILKIWDQFSEEISNRNQMNGGKLTIGASWYNTILILTRVLGTYSERYPNVDVRLVEKNSSGLAQQLEKGELDLVLVHQYPKEYPYQKEPEGKSFVAVPLVQERFLLAAVSLFLCGNFLLAALRFLRESWFWAALAFWMLLGGFLAAYFQVLTPLWVPSIPLPLLVLAAAGAGLLYLWQTKQLAFRPIGGFWKC